MGYVKKSMILLKMWNGKPYLNKIVFELKTRNYYKLKQTTFLSRKLK